MKLVINLNVSDLQFFNHLATNFQSDYEHFGYKKINLKDIKEGISYSKKVSRGKQLATIRVRLISFKKPEIYGVIFEGDAGTNTITYTIRSMGEHEIEVTYEEVFDSKSLFMRIQYPFLAFFRSRKNKKELIERLHKIETYIQKK